MGEIIVSPAAVVRRFGKPSPGEGYRSAASMPSSMTAARHSLGRLAVDYALSSNGPAPEEFWAREQPTPLSISRLDLDVTEFSTWMKSQLGDPAGITTHCNGPAGRNGS